MAGSHPLVLKNLRVVPDSVPNDGSGQARLALMVLTPNDDASIKRVCVDLSSLGGPAEEALNFDPSHGIPDTKEGLYSAAFEVPLLADPGSHALPVLALDTEGVPGSHAVDLMVRYTRPSYPGGILSEQNEAVFDRVSGAPLVSGNRIEVLAGGSAAMDRRMSLIRQARTQINLVVYSLDAEGACGRLVDALLDRAARGVEVNLLLNMASQLVTSPLTTLKVGLHKISTDIQELVRRLDDIFEGRQKLRESMKEIQESFQVLGRRNLGVNLILVGEEAILGDQPKAAPSGRRSQKWLDRMAQDRKQLNRKELGLFSDRRTTLRGNIGLPSLPLLTYALHDKVMVVDGRWAVVGGRNLEDRYFTHWVDLDLCLEGPVVRQVQESFLRNWEALARNAKQDHTPKSVFADSTVPGTLKARWVQSRPWLGQYQTMETLVTAFQMASERILITSQYIVLPESLLREALLDAALRGVEVHILTNSYTTGQEVGYAAGHMATLRYCRPLMDAGVRIYQMIGLERVDMPKRYLHAKTFLVDGKWAAIGSFNLSIRSCYIESECLVVVQDESFVREQEEAFWKRVRKDAEEITGETLQELKDRFRAPLAVAGYLDLFF